MKNKAFLLFMILVLVSACAFAGCGGNEPAAPADEAADETPTDDTVYTLKIANIVADTDDINVAAYRLEEELEAASNGRIEVEVYPNGVLTGSDTDLVQLVNSDTVQMGIISSYILQQIDPDLQPFDIWCVPYLFRTEEEYYHVADSEWGQSLADTLLEETGNVLAYGPYARSWIGLTANEPYNSLADIKGKNIRATGIELYFDTLKSLGANPVSIPFSEAFTALQQGTIDSSFIMINFLKPQKFYEVQKYFMDIHCFELWNYSMLSNKWVEALPEDLKTVFFEALDSFTAYMRDLSYSETEVSAKEATDNGMEVIFYEEAQMNEFIEAAESIYPKWREKVGEEDFDTVVQLLEEYRAANN